MLSTSSAGIRSETDELTALPPTVLDHPYTIWVPRKWRRYRYENCASISVRAVGASGKRRVVMSIQAIRGGCLCKAVRYESTAEPVITRVCWCRDCQYVGAGSGTVNVFFRTESFSRHGETGDYRSVADSGNVMHRQFCRQCGTPLFTSAEARPHVIGVRAGTLDDPNLVQPAMTIWTSSAPRWACIAESIPRVERQPPPVA